MKSMKKMLALVLSFAMAFALVGCSGSSTEETTEATEAAETEAAATEAAETEAAETEAAATEAGSEAAATGEKIVVGFAQVGAESDWRMANTTSMQETFSEENGYELIFVDGQQKQENQIKAIRDFIQQDVDYICLAPTVTTGWETVLGEAKDAGIPVIIMDRQIEVSDDSLFTAFVGSDFETEGERAGDWLADYLDKAGRGDEDINIVQLEGTVGADATNGRTKGFETKMAEHSNWKMLDSQTGEFTQEKGQEVMESMLKANDDIDVVYSQNDNMSFGAIEAIKAAGKTCGPNGDIIIITFDGVKAAFEAMIAGEINVAVECNPLHGPRVDEIIKKLEAGETVDKVMYVEEGVYDASTAEADLPTRKY